MNMTQSGICFVPICYTKQKLEEESKLTAVTMGNLRHLHTRFVKKQKRLEREMGKEGLIKF